MVVVRTVMGSWLDVQGCDQGRVRAIILASICRHVLVSCSGMLCVVLVTAVSIDMPREIRDKIYRLCGFLGTR
jgi:hypothetical protein